jgi:hypothetical protein
MKKIMAMALAVSMSDGRWRACMGGKSECKADLYSSGFNGL